MVGGLKQKGTQHGTGHVPLLSELPTVGSWFSYEYDEEVEEELLILITPRVVEPGHE